MIPPRIHLFHSGHLSPVCTVRCDAAGRGATAVVGQSLLRSWPDPLDALAWISQTFWPGPGRWIGYLSYDLGRLFETLPTHANDDLQLPLFVFTYCRPASAGSNLPDADYGRQTDPLQSNFNRTQYQRTVSAALDYIAAGDVFQVNLAQRFSAGLPAHPLEIYRRLAADAPAQYPAYLGYEDFALICNSPELFFRITPDRRILTRPIKGTRPRGDGMADDLRLSLKDQAELNMIIDLERNDLGRVCEIGSVKVLNPRTIETHPTVFHGSAAIEGQLRADVSFVDLLRALFPGGSVTGAPKIRAMQIIEQLEPFRRGPYCGAIGAIHPDGACEFAMAIRTIIAARGRAFISVGGGIVADSNPSHEYEETLVKAQAMVAALGLSL